MLIDEENICCYLKMVYIVWYLIFILSKRIEFIYKCVKYLLVISCYL